MAIIYIILGIIQGFTEPIPISSSGHLIIIKHLFQNNNLTNLNFEVFVNFGSLIGILCIFKNDILKIIHDSLNYIKTKEIKYYKNFKYLLLIIIGTIPAGIIGVLIGNSLELYLNNIKFIGFSLLITALFLYLIRDLKGQKTDCKITFYDALKIGLFQAIALLPGISRSGATIVGSMFTGLTRETAFKYSFMLYIPISIATMLFGATNSINDTLLPYYILSAIIAGITTYYSAQWFKNIMVNGKLIYFVYYCLVAGTLVILFL